MDSLSNQELKILCLEKFEITSFPAGKPEPNEEGSALHLLCTTSCGLRINFWGDPDDGFHNINMLKDQKLPVIVGFDHTDCLPSAISGKNNIAYSVPAHILVTIIR